MATVEELRQKIDDTFGKGRFQQVSADVASYLHQKLLDGGEDARVIADLLHGKGIGHPLHPILTDLTIGGWTFGVFFDALAFLTRSSLSRHSADTLITLGTVSAVPTALAGITDYQAIKEDAAGYAAAHGLLNGVAFLLFAASMIARLKRNRGSALFLSALGLTCATLSAWMGGDMVYRHRVGVNHAKEAELEGWTVVMAEKDLKTGALTAAKAGDESVLLFRKGKNIYAIGAVCSHAGGPLEEGTVVLGNCVECPWHQSVFDLRDGAVIHGPSTFNQPRYSVRTRNDQIEVQLWTADTFNNRESSDTDSVSKSEDKESIESQAEGEQK